MTSRRIKFTLFDMSGHDRYRALWCNYYRSDLSIAFSFEITTLTGTLAGLSLWWIAAMSRSSSKHAGSWTPCWHMPVCLMLRVAAVVDAIARAERQTRAYTGAGQQDGQGARSVGSEGSHDAWLLMKGLISFQVMQVMGLERIAGKPWNIVYVPVLSRRPRGSPEARSTSALTGDGIPEALTWLAAQLKASS